MSVNEAFMTESRPGATWISHALSVNLGVVIQIERRSLVRVVEVLAKDLVHCEHVDLVLLEDCPHSLVTSDLAFIIRVLKVFGPNICPYPLDGLRARQL